MIVEKIFTIKLETKEPLRIGGKKDPLSGADNPVTRVGGKLVIPGSTLKGALRSEIERFLITSYFENGKWKEGFEEMKPCIPGAELSADEQALVESGKYRGGGSCHYPCTDRKCGRSVNHSICPACYLLGAMGLPGFVKVPFLYAEGGADELYSSRIDRATKTVASGTNRPYELVPDGTIFIGKLTVLMEDTVLGWKLGEPRRLSEERTLGDRWLEINEGKKETEELIKTYIIDRLQNIKTLGGYKSKGFGLVTISVTES